MNNDNMRTPMARSVALGFSGTLLAACGGGNGPDVAGIDAGGAPPLAIIASAPVTGFGSVIAGGVSYSTSGAEIVVDGSPSLESALETGQQIVIIGELGDSGAATASRIEFEHAVIGPIDSIDLATRDLVILGQPARADSSTGFASDIVPGSLEGLSEGQVVAVSGVRDSDGRLFPTRIATSNATDYRLVATAEAVDTSARTIRMGDLEIDYGSAMVEGFAGGEPSVGDTIRVVGTRASEGDPLVATRIELSDGNPAAAPAASSARVILEGFVTRFGSSDDFDVDGIAVTTSPQTQYVNGSVADIADNARLRADGTRSANGSITAERIEFRVPGTLFIEARLDGVDAAANTLTVAGVTIFAEADTRFDDLSGTAVRPFGIDDLAVGDQIEIRGFAVPGGIRATRVEREDDDGDSEIEISGFVTLVADPSFEIAGIVIVTDGATEFDDIDRSEFFAEGVGWRVEVEGDLSGGSIVAEEVEREEVNDGDVDDD